MVGMLAQSPPKWSLNLTCDNCLLLLRTLLRFMLLLLWFLLLLFLLLLRYNLLLGVLFYSLTAIV